MSIATLAIAIVLVAIATLIFYSACIVAGRGDSGEETQQEQEHERQHGNT